MESYNDLKKQYQIGVSLRSSEVGFPALCDRLDMIFKVLIEILNELQDKEQILNRV